MLKKHNIDISEIAIGFRPVRNETLQTLVIAVIIRGTNGTIEEWSSNMDIGDTRTFSQYPEWTNSAHHMGFDITSNRIMDAIAEYVENDIPSMYNGCSRTYWVTGHSRGGALANLVAAKLIDDNEKVFAYTFAAPATIESSNGAPHAAKYDSIFNIVNEDDFIPLFPLKQWGFTLYGRTTDNISISESYSTLWSNSWKDYNDESPGTVYVGMESPEAPLNLFGEVAPTRNSCYDYRESSDGYVHLTVGDYPSNTEGYYRFELPYTYYQSPMFLMKVIAAYCADEMSYISFGTLNVAEYLEDAVRELIDQASNDEMTHPHLPQTYVLIAEMIDSNDFSQ